MLNQHPLLTPWAPAAWSSSASVGIRGRPFEVNPSAMSLTPALQINRTPCVCHDSSRPSVQEDRGCDEVRLEVDDGVQASIVSWCETLGESRLKCSACPFTEFTLNSVLQSCLVESEGAAFTFHVAPVGGI